MEYPMIRHNYRIPLLSASLFLLIGLSQLQGACPAITPSPYWKNGITAFTDSFRQAWYEHLPGWVKFAILTCDPSTVYFQDSRRYSFHYDFAKEHLDPYLGIARSEFDRISLHSEDQELVLGAVLFPPIDSELRDREFAIQLVRYDPYETSYAIDLINTVKAHVQADPGVETVYIPTSEQLDAAMADRETFEAHGISVQTESLWIPGNRTYAEGWALGRLTFIPHEEIENAFHSGSLRPKDILVTDRVPSEIPLIAGIITRTPATPYSHTAIRANTFAIPFAFINQDTDNARVDELLGQRIVFSTYNNNVRLIEIEAHLSEDQIDAIKALKAPQTPAFDPVQDYGSYSASTDKLTPSDIRYFGGKASNFGFLRRAIPAKSPQAAAFSFDLWNNFLDQELSWGPTLREYIASLLAPYSRPPADMQAFADDLASIRDVITDIGKTFFTEEQENAILSALQDPTYGFDPYAKLRFRSSTNVEDTESISGAGLYTSKSGCLQDDLDDDTEGPSFCDAADDDEKGVFRAIREVFAGFYNEQAVLMRLQNGINDDACGMALLVHHSFPDTTELANGVATLQRRSYSDTIHLVTQTGAVSVTNPEPKVIPEEVRAYVSRSGSYTSVNLEARSSLVVLGETVLTWDKEYLDLIALLEKVTDLYEEETKKESFVLDFEYKKVGPEGTLIIKQVREVPQPQPAKPIAPFLVNEPLDYTVFQGEYSNVFALQRLKSRWRFETKSMFLTEENISQGIYTNVSVEYTDGCSLFEHTGPFSGYPDAAFSHENETVTNRWMFSEIANPRRYELTTQITTEVDPSEKCPVITQRDFPGTAKHLQVTYATPVLNWEDMGGIFPAKEQYVQLTLPLSEHDHDLLQSRSLTTDDGVTITTQFYWPPEPTGIVAGYTAPLVRWVETTIEGLASVPIVLTDPYAQTYRPQHHNFSEHFTFVPALDKNLSEEIKAELKEQGRYLVFVIAENPVSGTAELFSSVETGDLCLCSTALFIRGDTNSDLTVDISDAVTILIYLFGEGVTLPVLQAADINNDTMVDISDAVTLLSFLFAGGAEPAYPFPEPGCL